MSDPVTLAALKTAESELLQLASALDASVERGEYALALLLLGQRSRTLFRAFLELQEGEVPLAGRALIRPMVEINLLVRFLSKNPQLHTELWLAEYERFTLTFADDYNRRTIMTERWGELPVTEAQLDACREIVADARRRAREANIPGVSERGPVLPSTRDQLATIKELGADEAYVLAYRTLSWEIHGGSRAFLAGTFTEHDDGRVSYADHARDDDDLIAGRALATTTFASTLVVVTAELHLGIGTTANDIKSRFVRAGPRASESL